MDFALLMNFLSAATDEVDELLTAITAAKEAAEKTGIKPIKYCADLFLACWNWMKLCESLKTYTLTTPVNDQPTIPKGYLRWLKPKRRLRRPLLLRQKGLEPRNP